MRGVVSSREPSPSQPAATTMATTTPTKTAKSHTQNRDHAHDRHDPDLDRTLARVRHLGHVPAPHPDRRARNRVPLGREHRRDRGLDRAPLRPPTHRRTTTTRAVRERAKRPAIGREPRQSRPTKRSRPSTIRAHARLHPIHHQSTKRAIRNTIADEMIATAVTVGTSTVTTEIARPRVIEIGIAIAIATATRADTIGTTIERTTAAAADTETETNGINTVAVVTATAVVTIGIDLRSTTGIGIVGDKVVLPWSVGCLFLLIQVIIGNAILKRIF